MRREEWIQIGFAPGVSIPILWPTLEAPGSPPSVRRGDFDAGALPAEDDRTDDSGGIEVRVKREVDAAQDRIADGRDTAMVIYERENWTA